MSQMLPPIARLYGVQSIFSIHRVGRRIAPRIEYRHREFKVLKRSYEDLSSDPVVLTGLGRLDDRSWARLRRRHYGVKADVDSSTRPLSVSSRFPPSFKNLYAKRHRQLHYPLIQSEWYISHKLPANPTGPLPIWHRRADITAQIDLCLEYKLYLGIQYRPFHLQAPISPSGNGNA